MNKGDVRNILAQEGKTTSDACVCEYLLAEVARLQRNDHERQRNNLALHERCQGLTEALETANANCERSMGLLTKASAERDAALSRLDTCLDSMRLAFSMTKAHYDQWSVNKNCDGAELMTAIDALADGIAPLAKPDADDMKWAEEVAARAVEEPFPDRCQFFHPVGGQQCYGEFEHPGDHVYDAPTANKDSELKVADNMEPPTMKDTCWKCGSPPWTNCDFPDCSPADEGQEIDPDGPLADALNALGHWYEWWLGLRPGQPPIEHTKAMIGIAEAEHGNSEIVWPPEEARELTDDEEAQLGRTIDARLATEQCSCPGWCLFNPDQHHVNCECKATNHNLVEAAHREIERETAAERTGSK